MEKKLLIVLCFVFLVLLFEVKRTYSLFETNSTIEATSELANWNIRVNNSDITNLTTANNNIQLGEINWESQNHVVEKKAAPGSVGKFNIEIDSVDTEVSFIYELTIDLEVLNNSEFYIEYIRETNNHQLIRTGKNTYSAIITLAEIQNNIKHNIEVGIKWNDNEENNRLDYELGVSAGSEINIPISILTYQYTGVEVLDEYVEDSELDEVVG